MQRALKRRLRRQRREQFLVRCIEQVLAPKQKVRWVRSLSGLLALALEDQRKLRDQLGLGPSKRCNAPV